MSVVLPEDSGPNTSTMRPLGTPPMPSARSSDSAPVGIASTRTCAPSSPMRMTEPLPNSRSIWPSAPLRPSPHRSRASSCSSCRSWSVKVREGTGRNYANMRSRRRGSSKNGPTRPRRTPTERNTTTLSVRADQWCRRSARSGHETLLAGEGLARGRRDLDLRQLARSGKTGEVDDLVVSRAAALALGVGARLAFDQHLHRAAHKALSALQGTPLHHLHQPFHALYLDRVGHHALGQLGRLRAPTGREDEREGAVVADLLGHLQRLCEVLLALPREAHDDVGRERDIGHVLADQGHAVEIALTVIRAAHRLEYAARARLQRQVDVL